jgi:hypothetical protein
MQLDYQSLTSLSDRSRVDTCRTLRQLFRRMSQTQLSQASSSRLALPHTVHQDSSHTSHGEKKQRRRRPAAKHTKVRGPTLARVVIANSSKPSQIALVKPGERRKKSSSSSVSRAYSDPPSGASTPLSPPPPYNEPEQLAIAAPPPAPQRRHTTPEVPRPRRKASAADVRPRPLDSQHAYPTAARSTPGLLTDNAGVYTGLASPPNVLPRRRKPTPTYYSMASDSTKLGEIPLHRWPEPFDFDAMSLMNRAAEVNGWPADQVGSVGTKKKRFGLMRLFRKDDGAR